MILAPTSSRHQEEAPAQKLIELRALLAQKFPAAAALPARALVPTGVEILDRSLGGGLPQASLTEIVCPAQSMGSGTIIQSLIEATQAAGKHLALVDAGNSFDPDGSSNEQLAALLWVRCDGPEQAIKAADLLCRDNNLPLVVLDLMMCSPRQVQAIASTYWYRLQRVAEGNGSVVLAFTPVPVVGSAACTLRLTHHFRLPALDLLRDQLAASLGAEPLRTRTIQPFHSSSGPTALAVG